MKLDLSKHETLTHLNFAKSTSTMIIRIVAPPISIPVCDMRKKDSNVFLVSYYFLHFTVTIESINTFFKKIRSFIRTIMISQTKYKKKNVSIEVKIHNILNKRLY